MPISKYYNDLYEIEDKYRKDKYIKLLELSLQNDLDKWTISVHSSSIRYDSPIYKNSRFVVIITDYIKISFIEHLNNSTYINKNELISDNFSNSLENLVTKLRENIYTPDIYEIEKLIGNNRKEKLKSLELNQIQELINDTYNDWLLNENVISAKYISKIIYFSRKNEEIYNLWIEKFKNNELIINELDKLKGN